MSISQTPTYNLKVVLKETGIAADTLRAWERRYGLPMPERTPGGHRLYSQHDIELIKWLIARQEEGLTISRAVDLWNEQIASGADPLAVSASTEAPRPRVIGPDTNLETLRDKWLAACMNFNEEEAEQILSEALDIFPAESVCTEILQHSLSEIGLRWYKNQASVQQEHFASALAIRRLDSLISAAPAPTLNQIIVIGCPPTELHTFTPLLLTFFLKRRGYKVIYLGASVPDSQFTETISNVHADLTVLVAQQLVTAATLQRTAHLLSEHGAQVGFGGRIYNLLPSLIRRTEGHFLGTTLKTSIEEIEALVTRPSIGPRIEAPSEEYVTALEYYKTNRQRIEYTLFQTLGPYGLQFETAGMATQFLGDNILAALQLGDIALVDNEIDWVRALLKSNNFPDEALGDYMQAYAEAVTKNINGAGKPVTNWLKKYVNKKE